MMDKYFALVKKLSDDIEEEVTLDIDGLELTCFAGVCPYEILEGKTYPVMFNLMIADDYIVEESPEDIASIKRINTSFSYWITGKLEGVKLISEIQFEDDIFLSDFSYLNDKMVRIKADRIDVEFLNEKRNGVPS